MKPATVVAIEALKLERKIHRELEAYLATALAGTRWYSIIKPSLDRGLLYWLEEQQDQTLLVRTLEDELRESRLDNNYLQDLENAADESAGRAEDKADQLEIQRDCFKRQKKKALGYTIGAMALLTRLQRIQPTPKGGSPCPITEELHDNLTKIEAILKANEEDDDVCDS